ncbi:helix-turn-helix domain-containing protein [Cryptosporangium sp. NPDC051539]|uniref:helix-turn-helix domain-containing protein n=1 Tax=Cryptosporangium sp. NPDC051539 TaxID=3363962 RepID=UPI00379A12B4
MPSLEEVRRQKPIENPETYRQAYAEADLASRLAEIVYRLRTNAGLTQTELARRMGTTQSAIARVEAGGSTPTLDLLDRVGRAIDAQITLTVNGETLHFGASAA